MSIQVDSAQLEKMSSREALDELSVDPDKGLSKEEAERRLHDFGQNIIEEERRNPLLQLLSHFWGPIPWMIEIAVILSAVAQRWEDFGVIFTMLLINGGVSFWHENKATNAIEALKEKLALRARVIRGGDSQSIEAKNVVPGDIAVIRMGDIVPADAKLLPDQHLSVDESALTGESLPVDKEEGDLVYSSTTTKRGQAKAVVTATGGRTKFARTVELVERAQGKSHFRRAVLRIGYFLIGTTAVLAVIIISVSILRGDPLIEVLLFALALTLAGIPQALPAVLSVTMTVGASRLARWKAIVSRLASMEEMAGLEILCADKTGTLTRNELELQQAVLIEAEEAHDVVLAAALTAERDTDDPIDRAVLAGLGDSQELNQYKVVGFEPFDPTRKRAEAEVERDGSRFSVAKGAPQSVLQLVDAGDELRQRVTSEVDRLGEDGFRSLGVARKDDGQWRYLGILPLLDPPWDDSAEVVREAHSRGVDVRMVTGDHTAIGRQVAERIGLGDNIKKASELFPEGEEEAGARARKEPRLSEELLAADGFSEVTPEHKFSIIKAFQANDRIVGMTGDGVNDAPALRQADVGIAVPGATDAARAAADIVLTERGLAVIINAIEEARRIFSRMISYATFRITESMRVLLFMAISILALHYFPVTPIMIVLLAILNDIPIMTIAWDNARTASHPVRWRMHRVLAIATVLGVAGVGTSFLMFWFISERMGLPREEIQTMMFLKLLVAGHMTIFLTRTQGFPWQRPWPSGYLFAALEGTQVIGTLFAVYGVLVYPVGWTYALAIWGYALVAFTVLSLVNVTVHRALDGIEERSGDKASSQQRRTVASRHTTSEF